jgi:hypothetical protein
MCMPGPGPAIACSVATHEKLKWTRWSLDHARRLARVPSQVLSMSTATSLGVGGKIAFSPAGRSNKAYADCSHTQCRPPRTPNSETPSSHLQISQSSHGYVPQPHLLPRGRIEGLPSPVFLASPSPLGRLLRRSEVCHSSLDKLPPSLRRRRASI